MQEIQVRSLCQEDPLEKEMATYSNILAWRIPWTEEPGGLQFMGLQRVGLDLSAEQHSFTFSTDREAWRAAVHGVSKSGTRLSDRTELNISYKA